MLVVFVKNQSAQQQSVLSGHLWVMMGFVMIVIPIKRFQSGAWNMMKFLNVAQTAIVLVIVVIH